MSKYNYCDVFNSLEYKTGVAVFMKKNGDMRVMLATRNVDTIEKLGIGNMYGKMLSYSNRCNQGNGNIPVMDIILADARTINVDRLLEFEPIGVINTQEDLNNACGVYKKYVSAYKPDRVNNIEEL